MGGVRGIGRPMPYCALSPYRAGRWSLPYRAHTAARVWQRAYGIYHKAILLPHILLRLLPYRSHTVGRYGKSLARSMFQSRKSITPIHFFFVSCSASMQSNITRNILGDRITFMIVIKQATRIFATRQTNGMLDLWTLYDGSYSWIDKVGRLFDWQIERPSAKIRLLGFLRSEHGVTDPILNSFFCVKIIIFTDMWVAHFYELTKVFYVFNKK